MLSHVRARLPGFAPRCPVHTPRATPFRALVCNAAPENGSSCCRAWVAYHPRDLGEILRQRAFHEDRCTGGLFRAAGL
ncbi:hypothetical protein [Streptomyces sp. NPDC046978]|uniref:hypothetical protein n=1 Tax=Streptomyces sp. NPDC046978 TaxID=3154704 RepID=UPI003408FAB8